MKKIIKNKQNQIALFLFLITMAIAISPLISRYCINGHDLEYHLLRIESLKEGILIGKPFLKVNTLFFGGAGYASSMFYPDLLIYIPALLRVCGLSIGVSYHIYVAIIFILTYASTYYCSLKISKSEYAASLAAILLTLCPYHMDDMLVRGACGEYMAFIFIPFVIYGVYNVLFENMDKPWVFALGFAGLILSHPATTILCVIFAFLSFLIYVRTFIKSPVLILKLVITTIVTMLLTAFQWIPMMEQMLSTKFGLSSGYVDMLDAAVDFSDIFTQKFPAMGFLLLVLIIPRGFISKKEHTILGYADAMSVIGILFAVGAANIWPWNRLERIFSIMQFPWRMFTIASVLMAMADAIILVIFTKEKIENKIEIVLCITLAVSAALAISHQAENAQGYYDYGYDYYSYAPYTANVIGGEWLPEAVTDRDLALELSNHVITSEGGELPFARERAEVTVEIDRSLEYVDVPFIYYKGYVAQITDSENNRKNLSVTGEGLNGMSRVYTDKMQGTLNVHYAGTVMTRIAEVISLICILGIVIIFVIRNRKKD